MISSHQHTIQELVQKEIEAGNVKMRPKYYFIAHTGLIFLVMVLIVLLSVYLASFSVFILRNNGAWFVPAFGAKGVVQFIASIPWALVLLLAASVAALEIIMRKHTLSYRKPLLISVGGALLIVCTVGVYVGYTSFHKQLLTRAEGPGLPVVGSMYKDLCSRRANNVHRGVVVSLQENGFCIHDGAGKLLAFIMSPATKFSETKEVEEGANVVVLSRRQKEHTVHAVGIRKMAHEEEVRHMADATVKEVAQKCKLMLEPQAP